MARRNQATIEFDALSIEGGLLPPEWLGRVAALDAGAQSPADYGIKKGLQLRDEITRNWRMAEALWAEFASGRAQKGHAADAVTHTFVRQLLVDVFGFGDLAAAGARVVGDRSFPISYEALGGRVPVVAATASEKLDDSVPAHGDGTRRRSAWGALQEYLNASDNVLWGVACNGYRIRLGRDNASLTRPAWLEGDLERIFTEERFADFSVLWLTLHASRFGRADQPAADAPLEAWRAQARERGSRARKQLRTGVEAALGELGQGFLSHPANAELRAQLAAGALTPQEYFNELLRLVYRVIFLLTLEEREILHPGDSTEEARWLYAEGYGLRRLRERAVRRAGYDRHTDLWASLGPVFSALGRPGGEPALGLRGLGGLFAPDQCPHLDGAAIENRALLTALFRLAWIREADALARVNWRDMGPEELGSVYESLLELVPLVSEEGRRFTFAGADESAGNARKLTGSYYTPDDLVQELLDSALEPVVAERLAAHPDDVEYALLSLSVIDPACGSGHFLLAAARRLATHLARARSGGTPGAEEYQRALRDVVTHCIHGVDRNPMALELARMALWLEAYTPDRALGFLDSHLINGDALLGVLDLDLLNDGIPDDAFKCQTGDDSDVARALASENRKARKVLAKVRLGQLGMGFDEPDIAGKFAALDAMPDDDVTATEAKRRRWKELQDEVQHGRQALAADCFTAAFLSPKTEATRNSVPTSATLLGVYDGSVPETHTRVRAAREVCVDARVLHWKLAFPQVFDAGGFDVVLGNPPWEVSQLVEEEYFTARAPEIAALKGTARKKAIAALEQDAPLIWQAYAAEKFRFESTNAAIRGNQRFELTATGKLNTYPLFAETAYRILAAPGRAGLVLPTGIATDDSTKEFFVRLVGEKRLVSLLACYEVRRWFSGTDDRKSFCLFTIGQAASGAEFAFQIMDIGQFSDRRKRFQLSAEDFRLLNPNTLTCPVFRSHRDAELTKLIYQRVPIFIEEAEGVTVNPWGVSFAQGTYNMTSGSSLFLNEPGPDRLPLYEGKMVYLYDHRWATYDPAHKGGKDVRPCTDAEHRDPAYHVRPEHWVPVVDFERRVADRHWTREWFIGWRDVALSAVERTVVAAVVPRLPVTHKMPLVLFPEHVTAAYAAVFLANLSSLVLDYVARQKLGGTTLAYFALKQFPVLPPARYGEGDVEYIVPRVLELTYTADDLTPWARDLGYTATPFQWDPERRAVLRAELDAYYAYLYRLTRDELRYVLDPADVMGPDYPSETFRVLKNNEIREFGEYRTRRLVLNAWDALAAGSALRSQAAEVVVPFTPAPAKPTLDASLAASLAVLALVWARGGSINPSALARAVALRSQPALLVQFAPPSLAKAAKAWAENAGMPCTATARQIVGGLVERDALRWIAAGKTDMRLATTPHTPGEAQLAEWFRHEARLLLAVVEAIPPVSIDALDAALSIEDRSLMQARTA